MSIVVGCGGHRIGYKYRSLVLLHVDVKMANSALTIGEIEENEGKCIWKVQNFSTILTTPEAQGITYYYSPVFTTATPISNSPRLSWLLRMHVNKESKIELYLSNQSQFSVTAVFKFYILSSKNEKLHKRSSTDAQIFKWDKTWGFSNFIAKSSLTDSHPSMMTDDTLRISCKLTFVNSTFNQDTDDYFIKMNHFAKLLDSGTYSDVTFVIGTQKLQLHKAVLAGMSSVLQAIFEQDTKKKKKETIIEITDTKYETMQEMFRYIYQRQVHDIKKNACDLLVVAEKYSVIGLKSLCEQALSNCLNVDNAIDNLRLAITHNATYLKSRVTDFVISHLKTFIDREDFKQMDSSFKDEIFRAIVQKEDEK